MINPNTGTLNFDFGDGISPTTTESAFLHGSLGLAARKGMASSTHQSYSVTVVVEGERWSMSVGFEGGKVQHVSLSPETPNASWANFSEDAERELAALLQKKLKTWLPGKMSEARHGMERYSFSWGTVAAGVVPQDATASISIRYVET